MATIELNTPAQIEGAQVLTLRAALRLEAHGLKRGRGRSALAIAKSMGLTDKRTAKGALLDVNRYIKETYKM